MFKNQIPNLKVLNFMSFKPKLKLELHHNDEEIS